MENKDGIKKVAILTNGGDAPGLNAVIRAVIKKANMHGIEVYGYIEGFKGILENNYVKLDLEGNARGLISKGGTIIGSSNSTNVFNLKEKDENGNDIFVDRSKECVQNIKDAGFDCIFVLGGDGSQKSARDFTKMGIKAIGIPKTIDNDVAHTERSFGFPTAVQTATDALDNLKTTAESHNRLLVLEVMGRYAGWIALHSAIAGGADACLIPEIEYDMDKVVENIKEKQAKGKSSFIVVVSEGAREKGGDFILKKEKSNEKGLDNISLGGAGDYVAKELEKRTGIVSRSTTLGYIQRGGSPIAEDRILSTIYGTKAMQLALDGVFNVLVTYEAGKCGHVSLEDVVGDNKEIGAPSGNTAESNIRVIPKDNDLLKVAKDVEITFGE